MRERVGAKDSDLPSAVLEEVSIEAKVGSDSVEMKLDLVMAVTDASVKLVRLPLGLRQMNWTKPPVGKGGHKNLIVHQSNDEGIVWFVETDGSKSYHLALEAVVPVESSAGESTVRLDLPESVTRIRFEIPGRDLQIKWTGTPGEVLETRADASVTRALIRGRGGVGKITWHASKGLRSLGALEVESVTRLIGESDGRSLRGSTLLRVVSDNREGERLLTVRLPKGAKRLSSLPNDSIENTKPVDDRVEIKLPERSRNGTEETTIEWAWSADKGAESSSLDVGIIVEEAQRHSGQLSVVIPSAVRFSWLPNSDFSFVEQTPAGDIANAIEYDFRFNRPSSLAISFSTDQIEQIRWRPDYLVRFDRSEIRLEGVLTLNAEPQALIGLEIHGGDWQLGTFRLEKTGLLLPTEAIDLHNVRFPVQAMSLLGVGSAELMSGGAPLIIHFTAVMPLPVGDQARIALQLPRIKFPSINNKRAMRGNGVVMVDRGDWQLSAAEVQTVGMLRTSEVPNSLRGLIESNKADELPSYRFQSDGQEAKWVGRIRRVPRVVSADVETNLAVEDDMGRITRRWTMTTQGPLLDRLPIRVPLDWIVLDEVTGSDVLSDRVLISTNGKRLETRLISKDQGWAIIEPIQTVWPVDFELSLVAVFPLGSPSQSATSHEFFDVKFALPTPTVKPAVLIYSGSTTIEVGPQRVVRVPQAGSSTLLCTNEDGRVPITLGDASTEITVGVAGLQSSVEEQAIVERLWLQTIANATDRRDRSVMRIATQLSTLRLQLPVGWTEKSVDVLVEGKKAVFEADSQTGILLVKIPSRNSMLSKAKESSTSVNETSTSSTARSTITLELFHWSSRNPNWADTLEPMVPTLVDGKRPTQMVWQVVVSGSEYLWSSSPSLLSDHRWVWKNFAWHQESSLTQEALETELQASKQAKLPESTNRYTFLSISGTGESNSASGFGLVVIPRWLLWLPVALSALLLTAIWPRLGVARHPWLMLVVAMLLGLCAMWAPDVSIVLVQCALGSLFVVAFALAFRWALTHRGHRRSVFAGRSVPVTATRSATRVSAEDSQGSRTAAVMVTPPTGPSTQSAEGLAAAGPEAG